MDEVIQEAVEQALESGLEKQQEIVNNSNDIALEDKGPFLKESNDFQQEKPSVPSVSIDYEGVRRVARETQLGENDVEEIVRTLGITPNVILETKRLISEIDEFNRKVVDMDIEVKEKHRREETKKTLGRTSWTNIAEKIKKDRKLI